ncbi:sulfate ABC transporter permease subunit CysT [Ferrovibrio sp.]|uniref:sulfate ABC transporter permease subunit CysT n=1 Tax=Ferrovibrio sp. TaxID=1917215 RepID=UPI001B6149F4|nr:sulfate ABC transporter permease subunit CysT [Ferrovibrio sp.]MBP7065561.1 sulfate ABC transporter permease subunit CysT [Ferrovibrio sp.]
MSYNALPSMPFRPRHSVIPGFGLTLGLTLAWTALIVLIPLAGLFLKSATLGWEAFFNTIQSPRVLASLRLSFGTALIAALINAVFGLLVAWVLVRYSFPGRRVVDAMVDIPFALPTAIAGIALTALWAESGWLGAPLAALGIQVAFTPLGIVMALIFIGLPFVVRTVQPVLQDFEKELEEAAESLGANRWQIFTRVIWPSLMPATLTGFALALARGLGEYGSVIFIAGNLPGISEIAPLLVVIKLEEFLYAEATAIAVALLIASFIMLLIINTVQHWAERREKGGR